MDKLQTRKRRQTKIRAKNKELGKKNLTVHRTSKHIYSQIIDTTNGKVLASASTNEADTKKEVGNGGNIDAAKMIGKLIAERSKKAKITEVAFDRSGFKYHGRVKALADAAREGGLKF